MLFHPPTGLFSPPKVDLSNSVLDEFQQPEVEGYRPKTSNSVSENISNEVKKSLDSPLVKELVSDDKLKKKTVFPTVTKIEFVRSKQQDKPVRKPVKSKSVMAWVPKGNYFPYFYVHGNPQQKDQGYVDNGCSRHMTGNMSYLFDFKEFDGGYVSFEGRAKGGKITSKGTLKTEFKNRVMSEFCEKKGIKKEFSVARTPQKNGVAERRYRTLIEAARIMLADSKFLENNPIIAGDGPKWFFNIDALTKSMNYMPVVAGTNSNDFIGTKESISVGCASKVTGTSKDNILMPMWKDGSLFDSSLKNANNDEPQPSSESGKKNDDGVTKESRINDQERPKNNTQDVNTTGPSIYTVSTNVNIGSLNINTVSPSVTTTPLKATHANLFGDETEVDMSNISTTYLVLSTLNTRIHKDHSLNHVIGDV
nr:putative ribonuclease H-like domain-containing protein [Tanacetum cinerariifolium]